MSLATLFTSSMGVQDHSSSVGDLLKQVYAAHNSVKGGFQSQITKLQAKIAHLESVIAKCSSCPGCGKQLIQSKNDDEVIVVSQPENNEEKTDKYNKRDDSKRLKTSNDETKANSDLTPSTKSHFQLRMSETPSLFDESWERPNVERDVPVINSNSKTISTSESKNVLTKPDKMTPKLPKLKQVTLGKSFCFAVENKQNELKDMAANVDLSPSILAGTSENEFSQDLVSDPSELQQLTTKNVDKMDKVKFGFKFRAEVTRNREDRAKLNGFGCLACKDYYSNLDLSEEEMKQRMNNCSKHRDNHVPPSTPNHFWDVDFPTTQESKQRGDIRSTQYRPLQARRKRLADYLN